MFTGIIQDLGEITRIAPHASGGITAAIQTRLPAAALKTGASVACSGACLTVVESANGTFTADISPETLARTNLGKWREGTKVNLEPALKIGDTLDGHIVTGHVDGLAVLKSSTQEGNSWKVTVEIPDAFQKFIAEKGSVTLDGVSLTVNAVKDPVIWLMIIPHTHAHTCFHLYQPGDALNLEIDTVARYIARLHEK